MTSDSNSKKPASKWQMGLFLLMVLVGGGVGYLVYTRIPRGPRPPAAPPAVAKPGPTAPKLSAEQALAAIMLKDESIGHLENGPGKVEVNGQSVSGLDAAAAGFERLVELLPGELLPTQNLAIARVLPLLDAKAEMEQARELARTATKKLIDLAPDSAVGYWMAALVELQADASNPTAITDDVRKQAVSLLERATVLDPDNVIYWHALKEAATPPRDDKPSDTSKKALETAFTINPRNIFLLSSMLKMQTAAQDPAVERTLLMAQEVLKPLAAPVQRRSRVDLAAQLDKALQALKENQWNTVLASVRVIDNVVKGEEAAKADITRVNVHPLEFVKYEFSPEFYAAYGHPMPAWNESTAVKLRVTADDALGQLADVVGLKVIDFTLNGIPDILVLQPGKLRLYGREALDQPWRELASLDVPSTMQGMLAADLDRDERKGITVPTDVQGGDTAEAVFDRVVTGTTTRHVADPDIVVYGPEGVLVVRNDMGAAGDGPKLLSVENPALKSLTEVSRGVLFDLDHDGDLDLAFSSAQGVTLWENNENLTFSDISQFSQMPPPNVALSTMLAVDWDRDADIDLILAEPSGQVTGWLRNMRHGEFTWTPFDAVYEQLRKPARAVLLEADGNVSWDLLTVGETGAHLFLTATPRSGLVNFLKSESISERTSSDALVWDFDNDGFRDAAMWGDAGLAIMRGGPQGTFVPAEVVEGELTGPLQAVCCMDIERDGDQDLIVAGKTGVQLLINEGGSGNQWLTLFPMGQSDNKGTCNHDAVGSLVEVRSGGWYQAQVVDAPVVHFGLGDQPRVQQLRIVWTNGVPQDVVDQAGSVTICEPMLLKGSCPYVYTLANGEFSFFTDCLWAAPIGMQTAEGTIAPTRSWEYLLIPGERLTPHEGSYWVMMTEELWEAGYFDKVQLIAIDHPSNVEVYSNEKVGPPDIAQCKIHTVSQRRFPISVVDQSGRNLDSQLRRCDGNFVQAFDRKIRQGLTSEHYLELDLGKLENPREITLFLTGWIYPTDTSLNVAFFQDPEIDGPRMPSVWVPAASGEWKETIAYMGFPGGKTKTIAVDLSQAFLTADYRVRVQTTAEIYWDEAFFTVDEPAVELRQTPLVLESADLQYRGFSRKLPRPADAPQMYDASCVSLTPEWPAMRGNFTRYGSVTELVAEGDDMMAVIGAGDAITIRFAVPTEPPPEGWKRDFFLHSIGWDKDADLNTIYGQSSDPLPFRAMKSYPFDPEDLAPDTPAYEEYLRRYQTRQQDPQAFWRRLKFSDVGTQP